MAQIQRGNPIVKNRCAVNFHEPVDPKTNKSLRLLTDVCFKF